MILTVTSAVILVFAKNVDATTSRGSMAAGGPAQINFLLAGTGAYIYTTVSVDVSVCCCRLDKPSEVT